MELAAEQGFAFFLAEGAIFRGWALAEQGGVDPGIEQMLEGLAAQRANGAELGRPSHLALLAEAYAWAKRPEEGLRVLEEALATVSATGERSYEAELHRLKGELLHQLWNARRGRSREMGEARDSLRHAADVARRQGARSLELRAAVSLVRLEGTRRRRSHARRLLRDVYLVHRGLRHPRPGGGGPPPRRAADADGVRVEAGAGRARLEPAATLSRSGSSRSRRRGPIRFLRSGSSGSSPDDPDSPPSAPKVGAHCW